MSYQSYNNYREKISNFIINSQQPKYERAIGWGLCCSPRNPVSVTNTAEALEIIVAADLRESILDDKLREAVCLFLTMELKEREKLHRTRDIAMGMVAFSILGEQEKAKELMPDLMNLCRSDGSWPSDAMRRESSSLLATVHALKALSAIGHPIDSNVIEWLLACSHTTGACKWGHGPKETDFGATCFTLYGLSLSGQSSDKIGSNVNDIGNYLLGQMPIILEQVGRGDYEWVKQEPDLRFNIIGYGYGLSALHYFGFDLHSAGVSSLFAQQETQETNVSTALDCRAKRINPSSTWLYSVLEYALAVRAIKEAFDPFCQNSNVVDISIEAKKLSEESTELKFRQALLNEWEKEIIRSRIDNQKLIDSLPQKLVSSLSGFIKKELKEVDQEAKTRKARRLKLYTYSASFAFLVFSCLMVRVLFFHVDFLSIETFVYAIIGLVGPIFIQQIRRI